MIVFGIYERSRRILGDVVALAGRHLIRVKMAVVVIEEVRAVRRGTGIVAGLLQGKLADAGVQVGHIDVLKIPAIQAAH